MWPYWLMFLLPAVAATAERSAASRSGANTDFPAVWAIATMSLAIFIGYRLEVGGDWFNYMHYVAAVTDLPLEEVFRASDPGYHLLSWISVEMGWDIIGLNVMGGTIFAVGLAYFCRSLPRPWLALTVAVPYLVIVVGMGYARQGVALALSMVGLVALGRGSVMKFLLWVLLGATFHKSAVMLLPIAALAQTNRRVWQFTWVVTATWMAYALLLADSTEALYLGYVEAEYASDGALIRLLMNSVPGILVLIFHRRFRAVQGFSSIWVWFAVLSIVLLVLLQTTDASTAVDRIGLYLLPLQLMVFSALPDAFADRAPRQAWVASITAYYALVQFVFFNFATHAQYWLPYRFYPLEQIVL